MTHPKSFQVLQVYLCLRKLLIRRESALLRVSYKILLALEAISAHWNGLDNLSLSEIAERGQEASKRNGGPFCAMFR
jgi:hypothetical protein